MQGSLRKSVGLLAVNLWKQIRANFFPYSDGEILDGIRNAWTGKSALFGRESRAARGLHDLTQRGHDGVDEKTWTDLDLSLVFEEMDFTATDIGQQYLYRKLRRPVVDEDLLRSEHQVVETLRSDARTRESILLALPPLASSDLGAATRLLYGDVDRPRQGKPMVVAWAAGVMSLFCATVILGGWLWYLAILGLCVNFVACQISSSRTSRLSYGYHVLYQMLCVAQRLSENADSRHIPACAKLLELRTRIVGLRRRCSLLGFSQASANLFVAQAMHLVNLFTAIEPVIYAFNAERIESGKDTLREVYESIGSLEALIAIARYRERYPEHCAPTFNSEGAILLESAYHPLIENPVANDFDTNGQSAMITGSNMAGKTSFIKMVGLNLVLARTIWTCHARSANLPPLGVATSIRTEDGITEGRSFYFSELERVLTFVFGQSRKLLLIDEMYRGTNTVERIAGAAAVLERLSSNNIVLVTTHDVELARYLPDDYAMFHFDETGEIDRPFDYRLKAGVCRTRNALKLMESIGYPAAIVSRAREIAEEFDAIDARCGGRRSGPRRDG